MPPKARSLTPRAGSSMASTTIIRAAFLTEALSNVISAIPMIFNPVSILDMIAPVQPLDPAKTHPASFSDKPNAQAALLLQWLGAIVLALSVPLFLGLSDSPRMVATRSMTYVTLGAGEVFLGAVLLLQLFTGADESGAAMRQVLIYALLVMISLASLRTYVLVQRPDLLGDAGIALRRTSSGKRRSL